MLTLTSASVSTCNKSAFSFALHTPHEEEQPPPSSKAPMSNLFSPIHPCPLSLSSHINLYLLWAGYWAKPGPGLLARQEVCMSWLPSCSAHRHTLHINVITAANWAKQTICITWHKGYRRQKSTRLLFAPYKVWTSRINKSLNLKLP